MTGTRQTIQYSLALEPAHQGETRVSGYQGAEPVAAKPAPESPASTEQIMEEVCENGRSALVALLMAQSGRCPMGLEGLSRVELPRSAATARRSGNGAMVEPLRHRQTKGAATDMPGLLPPRHIPTPPCADLASASGKVPGSGRVLSMREDVC